MKQSKGFTLIELLAVIVVLAVVALIAIPVILNVIDKANMGALKDSAYGIIDSAEIYLAKNLGKKGTEIEFKCSNNKCEELVCENDTCTVKPNGEVINYKGTVDEGRIKLYRDGKVSVCIEKDSNAASKKVSDKEVTVSEGNCNYDDDYSIDENVSLKKYNDLKDELNAELADLEAELAELKTLGNATANDIRQGKTAVVQGVEITGTMVDKTPEVNALKSVGNATTNDIRLGKTALVQGVEVIGTMVDRTAELNALKSKGNASASDIIKGKTAVVRGTEITGTMEAGAVYYLGTATTYNIKNMFPNIDYTSLTASNFLVVSQGSGESHVSNGSEQTCWLRAYTYGSSVSYDNTTGQVTINRASSKANCSQNVTRYFTAHTYLVTGTITDVTS